MQKKFYKLVVFASLFLTSLQNFAQSTEHKVVHQKWEGGLFLGASQYQGDLNDDGIKELNAGYGLMLRRHLTDRFALRGNLLFGKLTGSDLNKSGNVARGFSFKSPVTEISILGEFDILGKKRYKDNMFHKTFSPYIFLGAGTAIVSPTVNYNEANNPGLKNAINEDKAFAQKNSFFSMPIGGGVKMDLTEKWGISLELGKRFTFNDYLDRVSKSANAKKKDTYIFAGLGITYKFPFQKDSDGDGVVDKDDKCPDIFGLVSLNGCPDTDGDGVTDKIDKCPDVAGDRNLMGCPDKDNDQIADADDECPEVAGSPIFKGCPDTDGDGIADKNDKCPNERGVANYGGCPAKDSDGDGIDDLNDKCPNEKGVASESGCPAKVVDTDGDGVNDKDDVCPDKAGSAAMGGCPDTDGDGLPDNKDKCPTVAGPISNQGCAEIKAADKAILQKAIYGVQFETSKATFTKTTFAILDQVVDVLNRYPEYNLTINGHTDSDGDDKSNQTLSESRAKACADYFVSKGIAGARMKSFGFGETKPVADNKNAEGKAKNRRVEFELDVK